MENEVEPAEQTANQQHREPGYCGPSEDECYNRGFNQYYSQGDEDYAGCRNRCLPEDDG